MFNFDYHKKPLSLLLSTLLLAMVSCSAADEEAVYMANGIKIGEVSTNSAILWTRITKAAEPVAGGVEFAAVNKKQTMSFEDLNDKILGPGGGYGHQLPEGVALEEAAHGVPGCSGEVRLSYQETGKAKTKLKTGWLPVDPNRDFTRHFPLGGLKPATSYSLTVEARKNSSKRKTTTLNGSFTTAPEKENPKKITFVVTTCSKFDTRDAGDLGHHIYAAMLAMKPDFFVHAGDNVYYDTQRPYVTHIDLARFKWNRMFGLPNTRALLKEVPSYWMKDDHDSWDNDCWPSMDPEMGVFSYEDGRTVYDEQVPMSDKRHYRTFRWGKDLQVWMVEVRDFRSPNFYPDGPEKSMWGQEQIDWFKQTVAASDATFKLLISPTPIVGPDHLWKADKNDNLVDPAWTREGDMLRAYIGKQKNMYYICGDRHWQYISKHPATGMIEYSVGASTDKHSTPLENPDTSMHLYYKPNVGGFLSVTVDRTHGTPTATFRHHGVMGDIYHEDVRAAVE